MDSEMNERFFLRPVTSLLCGGRQYESDGNETGREIVSTKHSSCKPRGSVLQRSSVGTRSADPSGQRDGRKPVPQASSFGLETLRELCFKPLPGSQAETREFDLKVLQGETEVLETDLVYHLVTKGKCLLFLQKESSTLKFLSSEFLPSQCISSLSQMKAFFFPGSGFHDLAHEKDCS
ncbi:hypothetical protein P7K49_004139 [Saguinus oedipus]|uniref:Uncharacterized protein n=1 Tax=Saguinus oedipus TaxID=9490 RepID=A0ABQ9W6K5_SAGOE|nr:hypothetical protein P7K49_004139 [Saguinus oedipus]